MGDRLRPCRLAVKAVEVLVWATGGEVRNSMRECHDVMESPLSHLQNAALLGHSGGMVYLDGFIPKQQDQPDVSQPGRPGLKEKFSGSEGICRVVLHAGLQPAPAKG